MSDRSGTRKKIVSYAFALMFIFGAFIAIQGSVQAAAPPASSSNTVYLNSTTTYYHDVSIANSGTTTTTVPYAENSSQNSVNFGFSTSVSSNGLTASASGTLGRYYYYQSSQLNLFSIAVPALSYSIVDSSTHETTYYDSIGTIYANISVSGNSASWSHTFNVLGDVGSSGPSGSTEPSYIYAEISPSWSLASAYPLTFSLSITETNDGGSTSYVLYESGNSYSISGSSSTESIVSGSSAPSQSSTPFVYGWYFNTASSSYSPATYLTSYNVVWSSNYAGEFSTNGQTSSQTTSGTISGSLSSFSTSFNPNGNDPSAVSNSASSWTYSYTLESQVQAQKTSVTDSYSSTQSPTENINWWNSSISYSISPPSGALNNPSLATTSGTINASTIASWSINHIISMGYGTGAQTDLMNVSGHKIIAPFTPTEQYQSFSDSAILNSGLTVIYHIDEYITYTISTTATPPNFASISQSPVTFSLKYSSPITLSEIEIFISGSLEDRYTSVGSGGTVSYSYLDPTFSPESVEWMLTTGQYVQYVNLTYGGTTTPAANSSSLIVLQSATSTPGFPIALTGSPSGSGYWDQEFTFNNTSDPTLMAGLNAERTNYRVELPTGSNVYSWVSSYNSTSVDIYAQLPNGTASVSFNLYPLFENFSAQAKTIIAATTTYQVLSPAPFMANATTTSSFMGIPGRNYNTTYQIMTYDVPLAPTTKYITAIINATWQFSGLYPSTYKIQENGQQALFSNVSGFGTIQVSTIQPSQSLGQSEPVSLTYLQLSGSSIGYQYYSDFSPIVKYTPFGSSSPITFTPGANDFNLPYGSKASVLVMDYWHQVVGSASFFVLDQSMQENIKLNVSLVSFIVNGTLAMMPPGSVSIASGGYNLTGANPEYIANGSSYVWYASAQDPQTFQMVLYSGIVTGNASSQDVIVPVGAPLSTLIINVEAYPGSGIGQLGNGGPATGTPTVTLRIDGAHTLLGTSFEGLLGHTYNITVYDVLGHLLLQKNITLVSSVMPETFNISTPSYLIGFVNNEAVNASSPLATQTSNLSQINTTSHYRFTTAVNQESEIYLTPGKYHLYTHDNLTNSINITLTNQSLYYSFNGQNISRITRSAFNFSAMQLTGSIYAPIQERNVTGNATVSLYIEIAGRNSLLSQSQTRSVMANMTIDILLNGNFIQTAKFSYISPGTLRVPLNLSTLSTQYSLNLTVSPSMIQGKLMGFQTSTGFAVVNYNPSNPPNSANSLATFLTSIPMEILYAILAVGEVINVVWKRLRRDDEDREESIDEAGTVIEANTALKVINKEPLTPGELAIWNAIDQKTRDKLMTGLTAGRRRVFVFRPRRKNAR